MRMPMVEVVPMSRPRTRGMELRLAYFVIPAQVGIQTRA
jgi:hypothetical protein